MQQIEDWLKKLGMAEYAQRFAENRIDLSVLRDLSDQDLKDLGVAAWEIAAECCVRFPSFLPLPRPPGLELRSSLRLPRKTPPNVASLR